MAVLRAQRPVEWAVRVAQVAPAALPLRASVARAEPAASHRGAMAGLATVLLEVQAAAAVLPRAPLADLAALPLWLRAAPAAQAAEAVMVVRVVAAVLGVQAARLLPRARAAQRQTLQVPAVWEAQRFPELRARARLPTIRQAMPAHQSQALAVQVAPALLPPVPVERALEVPQVGRQRAVLAVRVRRWPQRPATPDRLAVAQVVSAQQAALQRPMVVLVQQVALARLVETLDWLRTALALVAAVRLAPTVTLPTARPVSAVQPVARGRLVAMVVLARLVELAELVAAISQAPAPVARALAAQVPLVAVIPSPPVCLTCTTR